jgi:phage-related protein
MKKIFWIGTSKNDLKEFPDEVQDEMGHALLLAQLGKRAVNAKVLTGYGSANILKKKKMIQVGLIEPFIQ